MKYCNDCGCGCNNSKKFCPECGKEFSSIKSKIDTEVFLEKASPIAKNGFKKFKTLFQKTYKSSQNKVIEVKGLANEKLKDEDVRTLLKSKKFIASVCSILAIMLIIVCGNLVKKSMNTPHKLVDKFEQAVVNKDAAALKSIITSDDPKLILTESDLNTFIEYINYSQSYYSDIINQLDSQATSLKTKEKDTYINSKEPISIKFDEKIKKYKLNMSAVYISTVIPKSGTKVMLNDEEVTTTTTDNYNLEIGPLLQGNYKISASFESNFASADDEIVLDTLESKQSGPYFNISLMDNAFHYVILTTNYPNAKLYVNGSESDLIIGNNTKFGPIAPNTKLYAILNINGKEFKSSEVTYVPSTYDDEINLDFNSNIISNDPIMKSDEAIRTEVYSLLEGYLKDFAYSVNYDSFSYIAKYLDPASNLFLEQKTNITSINKTGIKEKFVAFKLIDLKIDANKTTLIATVEEVYDITNKDKKTTTSTFNTEYNIIYNIDKKAYLLSKLVSLN